LTQLQAYEISNHQAIGQAIHHAPVVIHSPNPKCPSHPSSLQPEIEDLWIDNRLLPKRVAVLDSYEHTSSSRRADKWYLKDQEASSQQ